MDHGCSNRWIYREWRNIEQAYVYPNAKPCH